jgi:xanthine dehydrogenase accessory factor
MLKDKLILIIGAGDFASGTIRRLKLAGAKVVCTELQMPLTVRRKVAFSEAIYTGAHSVEGVNAVHAMRDELEQCFASGAIPVVIDPETQILKNRRFDIVIDARMAKKNLGININDAPIVIGLGPGFIAGTDCHAVVETLAGHNLGRVIYSGVAEVDTGLPAPPEIYLNPACNTGFDANELVFRAPTEGVFKAEKEIGDVVLKGDRIGKINDMDVLATADGVLRGCIHDGVSVKTGLKLGDIDPSGDISRVDQISEKSNAIAGGVLEACLYLLTKNE